MILPRIRVKNTFVNDKNDKKNQITYIIMYIQSWLNGNNSLRCPTSSIARIVRYDAFDDTMIQVERNTILNLQKPIVTTMSSRNTIRFNP